MDLQKLDSIIKQYPKERRFALAVMQDMQRELSYIPREGLELLAAHVNVRYQTCIPWPLFIRHCHWFLAESISSAFATVLLAISVLNEP